MYILQFCYIIYIHWFVDLPILDRCPDDLRPQERFTIRPTLLTQSLGLVMKVLRGDCQCELSYHECSHNWYYDWYRRLAVLCHLSAHVRDQFNDWHLAFFFDARWLVPCDPGFAASLIFRKTKPRDIDNETYETQRNSNSLTFGSRRTVKEALSIPRLTTRWTKFYYFVAKNPLLPPVCRCMITDTACDYMARCTYDFLYCAHE